MKIAKSKIEITLTNEDKARLLSSVWNFEDGYFCNGSKCDGVICAECPLGDINDMAINLRRAIINVVNQADIEG